MGVDGERRESPWLCFVCGLSLKGLDDAPWGSSGTEFTFNMCPCCGVEFGYGDSSLNGIRRWRERWLADPRWHRPEACPRGWSLTYQLEQLPDRVR